MSNLREVQMCQLQILKDLAKVCDNNNIDYMLACGSLIGAVRHGGFIPWDDDIDVYMTLDNYRRFSEVGQKCLGDKYFVQNWRTEKGYGHLWTQVRMNDTTSMPLKCKNWDVHFGIHIDIFPIIGISDDQHKEQKQEQYFEICKALLAKEEMIAMDIKAEGKQKIINLLPRWFRRMMCGFFEKRFMIAPETTTISKAVWHILSGRYPSEIFFEFTEISFEDFYCKTMLRYHDYLTLKYGDYMVPPKKEDRVGHELNLGEIYMDVNTDFRVYKQKLNNE